MTFIDLFAGIGGIRMAFERAGFNCVFSSEIDKFACKTYQANFNEMPHGDITKINAEDIPPFDVLCAGFPCQPFSVAGLRKGFEDMRGTLLFEIIRIVKHHEPRAIFLENVKGLMSQDKGNAFAMIRETLRDLGYYVSYRILNAAEFGLPQNRKRVYIVALRDAGSFKFPHPTHEPTRLGDILETNVSDKYTITTKLWDYLQKRKAEQKAKGNGFGYKLYSHNDEKTGTLSARYGKDGAEILIQKPYVFSDVRNGFKTIHSWDMQETTQEEKNICLFLLNNRRKKTYGGKDGNPISEDLLRPYYRESLQSLIDKKILKRIDGCIDFVNCKQSRGIDGIYRVTDEHGNFPTLTASQQLDYVMQDSHIRKLTPRECARLQGFPDSFKIPVSDTQAYKQFGNSVAIPVVEAIAHKLRETLHV